MKGTLFGILIVVTLMFSPLVPMRIADAAIVPTCNTGPLVDGAPLLKADGVTEVKDDAGNVVKDKVYAQPCDFTYVIKLINNIIDFLLIYFATPLAAMALCYAGAQLLFSGGSSEKVTKAKKIISHVIVGYIIALAAWLVVKTIFTTLGFKGETFLH